MHEENETKSKILTRANDMFYQFGYSRVTMEEIATSLGISKKTLYKFFSNKEHLVKELVHQQKCAVGLQIDNIFDDAELNFMQKLNSFLTLLGTQSMKFNGPLMRDIMKNNPALWSEIREFRKEQTIQRITRFMEEGMEQGFIRADINKEIAVVMYISAVHSIFAQDSLDKLQVPENVAFWEIAKILFGGVLTDMGKQQYETNFETQIRKEVN
jgi:AcrR family transcriptional regulator